MSFDTHYVTYFYFFYEAVHTVYHKCKEIYIFIYNTQRICLTDDSHCKTNGKVAHDCCVNMLFMVLCNYAIRKKLLCEIN